MREKAKSGHNVLCPYKEKPWGYPPKKPIAVRLDILIGAVIKSGAQELASIGKILVLLISSSSKMADR